jgi:TldD protein
MDIDKAVAYGMKFADYVEIRRETNNFEQIQMKNGTVETMEQIQNSGIGVRVVWQGCAGYSSTDDEEKVDQCIERAVALAKLKTSKALLGEPVTTKTTLSNKEDIDGLDMVGRAGKVDCPERASVYSIYGNLKTKKHVVTSEGSDVEQELFVAVLMVNVFLGEHRGADAFGGSVSERMFVGEKSPEALGNRAVASALEAQKGSPYSGKTNVVMDGLLAGAIVHESVGHLCEADCVRSGYSPLKGDSVGAALASPVVTIIDEGVVSNPNYPGFIIPYDDENVKTEKVTIIEKGTLKGFLHARDTASSFGTAPTGNARALDYTYHPIPRMRNTFMESGTYTVEEALETLGNGLYLKGSRGGQASPDGTFMVNVESGYMVTNGEIGESVKNITIKGNVWDFLKNVQVCCSDFNMHLMGPLGGCGKNMQEGLVVGYGGPHILVKEMMV